jgi:pyrroloquinoline quinone (PQQ) biosynthesis protein C
MLHLRASAQADAYSASPNGASPLVSAGADHAAGHLADDAAAYIESLVDEAQAHRAVRHPYLHALSSGALPDPQRAMTDFARLYYGYSAHFPRYLTATISRLDDPAHRMALIENLTEESGHYGEDELAELEASGIRRDWIVGVPHPELFRRFRRALDLHGDEGLHDIESVCWREMFYAVIAHGSAAEAVGALGLGTETIVGSVYRHFVEALRRLSLPPEATVFFPLHCDVDDAHQESLKRIAVDLARSDTGREELRRGMRKALALRAGFWDHLLERARDDAMRKAA